MEFPVKVILKCVPNKPRAMHTAAQIRTFLDWSLFINETDNIVYTHDAELSTIYRQFATVRQAERFKRLIEWLEAADPDNAVVESVTIETA